MPITFRAGFLLILALSYGSAGAQAISNLQSIPVFFTCLAQEQELADDFLRDSPVPQESLEETKKNMEAMMMKTSWAVCVRRKKWVSKPFCRDVLNAYKSERQVDMRPVMGKHEQERQQLKTMYDYFEAAFPKGGVEPPNVPGCPE